jgi:hypothetical protein
LNVTRRKDMEDQKMANNVNLLSIVHI